MLDLISKPPETYFGTQDARAFPIKPHAGAVALVTDDLPLQRAGVCLIKRHLLRDVGGIPRKELAWDGTNARQHSTSDTAVGRRPRAVRFGQPCECSEWGGSHFDLFRNGLPSITSLPF